MQNKENSNNLLSSKSTDRVSINNSIGKYFDKNIMVTLDHLSQLNHNIQQKINYGATKNVNIHIEILLTNNETMVFNSWETFENYNYNNISCATKSVYISWCTNRATLTEEECFISINISPYLNSKAIVDMLTSQSLNEYNDMSFCYSSIICKVKHNDALYAKELINIVEQWVEKCQALIGYIGKIKYIFYKFRNLFSNIAKISSTILLFSIEAIVLKNFFNGTELSYSLLIDNMVILIPSCSLIYTISRHHSQKLHQRFSKFNTAHIFDISPEDKKLRKKMENNHQVSVSIFEFLINIIASIAISFIFSII